MSEIREKTAAQAPVVGCIEEGCDREAEAGDARCALHRERKGALPREEGPLATTTESARNTMPEAGGAWTRFFIAGWVGLAVTLPGAFWLIENHADVRNWSELGIVLVATLAVWIGSLKLAESALKRATTESQRNLSHLQLFVLSLPGIVSAAWVMLTGEGD